MKAFLLALVSSLFMSLPVLADPPHYEPGNQNNESQESLHNQQMYEGHNRPRTALNRLLSILNDESNPSPSQLSYSLTGDTSGVSQVLLQKTNGIYYLILWQEGRGNNTKLKRHYNKAPKQITVNVSSCKILLYDDEFDTDATQLTSDKVDVKVSTYPLILEITPLDKCKSQPQPQPTPTLAEPETTEPDEIEPLDSFEDV